ncbi:MAG: hypothetical protein HY433_02575 [Candidatus Liptonbacteria bacterium]|nr:hypothetical protein [Candidatus Liptonbacteria bacterium]
MQNDNAKLKNDFLENVIATNSIFAAFGRANIYSPIANKKDKEKLKHFIKARLKKYLDEYDGGNISEKEHISNIQKLADETSTYFRDILLDGRLRIGTAQKLLNLYLKYIWVLGWMKKPPPHCPFDSRVIGKLGKNVSIKCKKFTETDDENCYYEWVNAVRNIAGEKIAEWELRFFNETNRV